MVCLGNHTIKARSSPTGKRLLGFIKLPNKRESDTTEDFRYCLTSLYLHYWSIIAHNVNLWIDGFLLTLPGDTEPSRIVPRMGIFMGDIVELRMLAATSAAFSIRCNHRLDSTKANGSSSDSESAGSSASSSDDSDEDEVVLPRARTANAAKVILSL